MTIRTRDVARGAALFFGSVGLYCVYVGSTHRYYDLLGPGPGFFPIWVGALLAALSAALLVQSVRRSADAGRVSGAPSTRTGDGPGNDSEEPFFPSRGAAYRIGGMVASLAVVWSLLDLLGFRLTIFAFALLAPRVIDRQPTLRLIVVALLSGFGIAYGFEAWLGVQLPKSSLDMLRDLGM